MYTFLAYFLNGWVQPSTFMRICCHKIIHDQWWANPNPDLDLNLDLATFVKSGGFGFGLDLRFFRRGGFGLNLSFFKRVDLDLKIGLDLDLNITGFAHHC